MKPIDCEWYNYVCSSYMMYFPQPSNDVLNSHAHALPMKLKHWNSRQILQSKVKDNFINNDKGTNKCGI